MQESDAVFDPGFAELVIPFEANISACNGVIGQLKSLHQKKFKFKILYPQMYKLIENNVAFYYGCLLWGYYLSNFYKNDPVEISGNPFLEISDEDFNNYDMTYDVDYLMNYLQKFENDTKYFLGKPANLPEGWNTILDHYKDFVVVNKSFRNVKMTSDLIINSNFKLELTLTELKAAINTSINTKSIENLLKIQTIS